MNDPCPLSPFEGVAWPAVVSPAAASMLAIQWQLERSQWWAPGKILEHQLAQLRKVVSHAVRHVPYYAGALREAGVEGVAGLDEKTFRRWPVLSKSEVMRNAASLASRHVPAGHGRTTYTYTTGSTGEPTRVAHTGLTQYFSDALAIRDHLLHERDLMQKYGVLKSSVTRTSQPGWGFINALFATGPGVAESSSQDVAVQLDWVMQERPAYLQSFSSNLLALLQHSATTGRIPRGVRQLIGYGDMPPDELPALARELWDAKFVATYSCMELGPMASQSPEGRHYLVHAPVIYLELLREDGEPCRTGEVGRVVATALHNFAMPLIRYELGDYAEAGEPCPSGRGLPTLARIAGRYRNMLRHPNGKLTWPSFPGKLWLGLAPVRKVRLVQHTLTDIEVQYVMDRDLTEDECTAARSALSEKVGDGFGFRFSRLKEIERARGEKWEDFVSLVTPGARTA